MDKITIQKIEYPCSMTMGALLRFKQETGHDVAEAGVSASDMIILLWCCLKSACAAQKVEFPYSLMEFADLCDLAELDKFNKSVSKSGPGAKKK